MGFGRLPSSRTVSPYDGGRRLNDAMPKTEWQPMKETILQIGEGRFLRGFFDWMVQELAARSGYDGNVVVILPRPARPGVRDLWEQQGSQFSVHIRGTMKGIRVEQAHQIGVVSRLLDAHSQWPDFLATASNSHITTIVTNTTEAGLVYQDEPYYEWRCPNSVGGKLTRWLWQRYQIFSGSPEAGVDLLPCELIEENGAALKGLIHRHAEAWQLPAGFLTWLDHSRFFNTLVDSIVTDAPQPADSLDVVREPYYRWTIQRMGGIVPHLPFREAGLPVDFVHDLAPQQALKVRILNGAHTAMAGLGVMLGIRTVGEAMDHPLVRQFVERLLVKEAAPTLPPLGVPLQEVYTFIADVLERFQNPDITHLLEHIQLNALSKVKTRLLPTLQDAWAQSGDVPPRLTLAVAAQYILAESHATTLAPELPEAIAERVAGYIEALKNPGVAQILENVLQNLHGLPKQE